MAVKIDRALLIDLVRNEPRLWDPRSKDYHNRYVKAGLWKSIGEQLLIKGDQAHKTWENLRDTFRRKYKIQLDLISSQDASTTENWPYFKTMLFLKDVMFKKESSRSLPCKYDECSDKDSNDQRENASPTTDRNTDTGIETGENHTKPDTKKCSSVEPEAPTLLLMPQPHEAKRRLERQTPDYDSQVSDIGRIKTHVLEDVPRKKRKYQDDEDFSFFISLLPAVKQLSQLEKMKLRMKILGNVTEALEAHNLINEVPSPR